MRKGVGRAQGQGGTGPSLSPMYSPQPLLLLPTATFPSCCRDSMESDQGSTTMMGSMPNSFGAGMSVDQARMKMWKDNRAKTVWQAQDPATAFYSA